MTDIDPERIFIRREKQIDIMDEAILVWQRRIAASTHQPLTLDEQYRCVVWLFGDGGLGKSTLLRHYHRKLVTSKPFFSVGEIIDWSSLLNDVSRLRYFMKGDIDEIMYLEMVNQKLSKNVDYKEKEFKEYKSALDIMRDTEKKIGEIWKRMQKMARCDALWKIPTQKRLKLLQWFARAGLYELDRDVVNRHLTEYMGDGVDIDAACIYYLYEELGQRLGEKFHNYIEAGHLLSTAIGHDLQHFASKRPLLIFFDTYECIEKGDYLLRNIIEAAGVNVGWLIAGRSLVGTGSVSFSAGQTYKQNVSLPYVIIPVPFQAEGQGGFSLDEIASYFAQIRTQKSSLPLIGEQDVERIRAVTHGIPLAVNIVAQFYVRTGRLDALLERDDSTREVIEGMVERYLLYVPYDRKERLILYGLAILRRTNDMEIISQFVEANIDWERPIEEQLRQFLYTTHAVFIMRGQIALHQEIHHFLRLWLLEQKIEPTRREAEQRLQELLQARLDVMEKQNAYQRLEQRFEDDVWVNAYVDLVEVQFWIGINQGFFYCLPCMLASVIYRRDVLNELITLGNFFRSVMTPIQSRQWDWMVQGLQKSDSLTITEVESCLERLKQYWVDITIQIPAPFAQVREELEGAFCWRYAECYQKSDRYKAIYWYEEAIKRIEHYNTLREEAAYVCWLAALDCCEVEEYQKSLELLQKALNIKFDFAEANYLRGNIYCAIGTYDRAIIEYQYALNLDEHHIAAHINLGNTYLLLRRYQEAIELYNVALVFEPSSAILYNNRALAYTSLKDYTKALADYQQTIALQPKFAEAYMSRGTVYAYLHRYEEALASYNKAYELFPRKINIAWMKMWANLGEQHTLKREQVEALIMLDPEHYLARVCQGIVLALQREKLATILVELEQAILLAPEQWDHYFWKGMICCYYKNTVIAQEAFEKALAADLPPILFKPLFWLKAVVPQFFEAYAAPLLTRSGF